MVLTNSDSTGTLVSSESGVKRPLDRTSVPEEALLSLQPTAIYLPEDDFSDEDSFYTCSSSPISPYSENNTLYLPSEKNAIVDTHIVAVEDCLKVPTLLEARDELVSSAHCVEFGNDSQQQRVLYVAQGEVAHAVPSQCDVLMSDKATTCHILALRSTSTTASSETTAPLCSLTHLDGTQYETCLYDIVQRHQKYHNNNSSKNICMDVHILGGFEDKDGTSRALSNWLLRTLAAIADQYASCITMTLQTAVISSLNDNGHQCPIGRGFGLNLKTGRVFLAKYVDPIPCGTLRSARLMSGHNKSLHCIHNERSSNNTLTIEPFRYESSSFADIDMLLKMPDPVLLQYTSTSPDVEEDDFCATMRATLLLLRNVPCERVFGAACNRPLTLRRDVQKKPNQWRLVHHF